MSLDRRRLLAGIAGLCAAAPAQAQARSVIDGAGRTIAVPETVTRVFPAGPKPETIHRGRQIGASGRTSSRTEELVSDTRT